MDMHDGDAAGRRGAGELAAIWSISATAGRWWSTRPGTCARSATRPRNDAGCAIAFAADTHLHADFLSGAAQLAATTARRCSPRRPGGRAFAHRGLRRRRGGRPRRPDAAGAGDARAHRRAPVVPAARRRRAPVGVFTGGSLIVGAAARTDLLGADRTEELARAQYASLRRLADAARRRRGVADPRRRVVLLRPARGRADPHHRARSGPPTRCWRPATRTRSSRAARRRWAATRRTSCGSARPTGAARLLDATPAPAAAEAADRCEPPAGPTARVLVDVRPVAEFAAGARPRGRCRSRCGRSSRPGWAGSLPAETAAGRRPRPRPGPRRDRLAGAKIGYDQLAGRAGRRHGRLDRRRAADWRAPELVDRRADRPPARARRPPGRRSSPPGTCPGARPHRARRPRRRRRRAVPTRHGGDVRARRAGDDRGQPARTSRTPRRRRARRRARGLGRAPPASTWRPARDHRRRPVGRPLRLGLRANLAQFALLVAVNALVGGMLGQERTVLPLLAERGVRPRRLHRRADLHPRLRRHQGGHELPRPAPCPTGTAASRSWSPGG